jgi:hypothetical protein
MGSTRSSGPKHAAALPLRRSALPLRRAAPALVVLLVITLGACPAAAQPSRSAPSPAPKGALTLPAKPISSTAAQVSVLLDIKRVLDPRGKALTDWKAGSTNPCTWTGIGCDDSRRVTDINFWDSDFQKPIVKLAGGKLPSGALLRRLPRLATIDVGSTGVGGPLPGDWSQLGLLEVLNLDTNSITGAAAAMRGCSGATAGALAMLHPCQATAPGVGQLQRSHWSLAGSHCSATAVNVPCLEACS